MGQDGSSPEFHVNLGSGLVVTLVVGRFVSGQKNWTYVQLWYTVYLCHRLTEKTAEIAFQSPFLDLRTSCQLNYIILIHNSLAHSRGFVMLLINVITLYVCYILS